MKNRSEKLAWEIITLLSRYKTRDIEEAIRLLSGSEILSQPVDLVRKASKASPERQGRKIDTGVQKESVPRSDEASEQLDIVFEGLPDQDKAIIRDLAEGIVTSKYLSTSSALREFSSRLGLTVPKKLPARPNLALRIVEEILRLEHNRRSEFIEAAKDMSGDVSSLQRWSDLIVR